MSWPTLEPILIREGVFAGPAQQQRLTSVFSVATGLAVVGTVPAGILFDRLGPRFVGVFGALACAASMVGVVAALRVPALNWLLFVCYPGATLFGMMNIYCCYAYLWLLPKHQNTVNSLAAAVQALSDTLALVAVALNRGYGTSCADFFAGVGLASLAAAAACFALVPDRAAHRRHAAAAMRLAGAADAAGAAGAAAVCERNEGTGEGDGADEIERALQQYGAFDADAGDDDGEHDVDDDDAPSAHARRRCGCGCARERELFGACWAVATELHPRANARFVAFLVAMYMLVWYPVLEQYPFYAALLGKGDATRLVDSFALIYGFGGAAAVVCYGRLMDRVGLVKGQAALAALVPAFLGALLVRSAGAQLAAQVLVTLLVNVFMVSAARFTLLYAPPELFARQDFAGNFCFAMNAHCISRPLIPSHSFLQFSGRARTPA